jgi:class 3 adenylate cyclase
MTATRRLTTILAADVAGYSRLMGEDEVGTVQALSEHRGLPPTRSSVDMAGG